MRKDRHGPVGWALDHPWTLVAVGVLVWFTFWVIGTRQTEHQLKASFSSAFNLVPGLAISVDGIEVGKIGSVEYVDGKANVEIGINDEEFWPLHQGTRVISRWGTTIGSGTRRLDIIPGPATNPAIPQDGIIPTSDTQPAVDVDQVLNALNKDVRKDLQSWMAGMSASFKGNEKNLQTLIQEGGAGVESGADLLSDLATDTFALKALVRNGDRTTNTLARRDSAVRNLVTVAAQTFNTFATNTKGTQDSISELPATLQQARGTLRRVDGSIDNLDGLVTSLAPGAKALRPLAASARPAFADLRQTVPNAVNTLRVGTTAAPKIDGLLQAATPFMERGDNVFADLAPMVACVRPYAPEIGGALLGLSTSHQTYDLKANRYVNGLDALGKNDEPEQYIGREVKTSQGTGIVSYGLRAMPQLASTSPQSPLSSKQQVDLGLKKYAFPRPPGYSAGKPWFIEECGYTPDNLDVNKDPESVANGYTSETE